MGPGDSFHDTFWARVNVRHWHEEMPSSHSAKESMLEEESVQSRKEYVRWRNLRRKEQRKHQNTLLKALDEVSSRRTQYSIWEFT